MKTLEPIVTRQELDSAKSKVEDLLKPNGVGEKLQEKLLERAELHKSTSWLHEWWRHYAYMDYRESVVNNVSFFYLFDDTPTKPSQLDRASGFVSSLLHIKKSIENETFPAELIRDVPQCMTAYKNVFSSCRIPVQHSDEFVNYGPKESTHIIVARNNQFFEVNVHSEHGQPLHKDDIKVLLDKVMKLADSAPPQAAVGVLTADNRDKWSRIRTQLLESNVNKKSLNSIERSGFILCLDAVVPKDENDASSILLNGKNAKASMYNRFFDKPLNVVVFPDGVGGLVGEHSSIDGYPVTIITDKMLVEERKQHVADVPRVSRLQEPVRLEWEVNDQVQSEIERVTKEQENINKSIDLNVLRFKKYGKNQIKTFGFSPDGYLQMAFHLAYFRLHQKYAPTYESCSTRKYAYGRTETGRTLSTDVVNFLQSMNNTQSNDSERYQFMTTAIKSHIKYIKEASDGYGCDRHILGLKMIAQEIGLDHPFFTDPAMAKSTHWILSTSQLPSKHSVTGYGPVVSDGYGLFYNLRGDSFNFVITNFRNESNTDCFKMSDALSKSLEDLQVLCSANIQSKL